MRLNSIRPAEGAKRKAFRRGRGIGSGLGKTCGRGHKGQHARSGGFHKVGFEGGQMPLHRRIPKSGFNSYLATVTAEVRLSELNKLESGSIVDMKTLVAANIISRKIKYAKVIASGQLVKLLTIKGIRTTQGAKQAIEAAGGAVEE